MQRYGRANLRLLLVMGKKYGNWNLRLIAMSRALSVASYDLTSMRLVAYIISSTDIRSTGAIRGHRSSGFSQHSSPELQDSQPAYDWSKKLVLTTIA